MRVPAGVVVKAWRKKIHLRLDDDLHKQLRIRVAELGTTVQTYITDLLKKDLEKGADRGSTTD